MVHWNRKVCSNLTISSGALALNSRDPNSIRVFSDFLLKALAAKKTMQSLDVLDFAKENVKLLEKLPYSLQSKWRDQVSYWKSREGPDRYPPFTRFGAFVKEAADNACIPELESMYKPKQEIESTKPGKKDLLSKHLQHQFQIGESLQ